VKTMGMAAVTAFAYNVAAVRHDNGDLRQYVTVPGIHEGGARISSFRPYFAEAKDMIASALPAGSSSRLMKLILRPLIPPCSLIIAK
jgi:hypothetical protein